MNTLMSYLVCIYNLKYKFMRKYITEFIGTFFLVFTVGMVVIGGKGDFAPWPLEPH